SCPEEGVRSVRRVDVPRVRRGCIPDARRDTSPRPECRIYGSTGGRPRRGVGGRAAGIQVPDAAGGDLPGSPAGRGFPVLELRGPVMSTREQVEAEIRHLMATETDAVRFSNKLFTPGGLFSRLYTTPEEKKVLLDSPLFNEANRRLSE